MKDPFDSIEMQLGSGIVLETCLLILIGVVPVAVQDSLADPQDRNRPCLYSALSDSSPKCPRIFRTVFGMNSTRKSTHAARSMSHSGHHMNICPQK